MCVGAVPHLYMRSAAPVYTGECHTHINVCVCGMRPLAGRVMCMAIVCACMRAAFLSVIRSVVFRFMLAARVESSSSCPLQGCGGSGGGAYTRFPLFMHASDRPFSASGLFISVVCVSGRLGC